MNKVTRIFNPYSLLILAVFIGYYPSVYLKGEIPSISIGPVNLYPTDISFLILCLYAPFKLIASRPRLYSGTKKTEGRSIQIVFGLFFLLSCIKWLLQSDHDIMSIRILANCASAYAFLSLFPMLVTRKDEVRYFQYLLIIFSIYIFVLHILAFSARGYQMHILSGNFLTMLSLVYFLAASGRHALALPAIVSLCVKVLVLTTFFMVGHRSGFIGLLLGLIALSFFNRKLAVKEVTLIVFVAIIGAAAAPALSPDVFSKLSERASTTFDTRQSTYIGRYYQIFTITRIALEEHPIIGRPLTTEAGLTKRITRSEGNFSITGDEMVITPHNLFLEWLYYFGSVGALIGLTLVVMSARFIKRFIAQSKNDDSNYQIGVAILCSMIHNLFYALSNVTVLSTFATFFLYFPLVILVGLSRNEKTFNK